MNKINEVYKTTKKPSQFYKKYVEYLYEVLKKVELKSIDKVFQEFEESRNKGSTIFIDGNGGSASTATTMANDLGFDVIKKTGTKKPFKVLSLTDSNSVLTAISTDVGYDKIFLNELKIHFKKEINCC